MDNRTLATFEDVTTFLREIVNLQPRIIGKAISSQTSSHGALLERRRRSFHSGGTRTAGCAADGAKRQEAIAQAGIVIAEWIETARALGREIPAPKGRLLLA